MNFFTEISLIIVVATLMAGVMRLFKQPIIIGYILTGLLLGPQFLNLFHSPETIEVFSKLGITILLFIVGLNLSPAELASFGKSAFGIGALQVVLTCIFGFLLSQLLGFTTIESIYLSTAISFSSTIIVLKLISDKKDLEKLYARLCIGILLFQDIVAAVALVLAAAFGSGHTNVLGFLLLFARGALITILIALCSFLVLPKIGEFFAKSQEFLFLFSLAWGFGIAALFGYLGFSIEMGALIAGVALSMSPYSQEIGSKLKPLRDFFVVMFFITLGSYISFQSFGTYLIPILVFLVFILLIKPLIIITLVGGFSYNKKTAFLTGTSLGQISEFSMILILLAVDLGHVGHEILSLVTILGVLTILVSTYVATYVDKVYSKFAPSLKIFERKITRPEKSIISSYEVILFGCNRMGYDFIGEFRRLGPAFLAVDFDPDVIKTLEKEKINYKYGDAEDGDFLDEIDVDKATLVISTIPDFEANQYLVSKIRKKNTKSGVILISYDIDDALKLYELGATYVAMPHFIGGEYVARFAKDIHKGELGIEDRREKHLSYLNERKSRGHHHPVWRHHY